MINNLFMDMNKIIILMLLFMSVFSTNIYDLILQPHDRGAACLDGSPAAMYLNEGTGQNKNKFLVFFQGGGGCGSQTLNQTIQSCYNRSQTDLGSSKKYSEQKTHDNTGVLSTLPTVNPNFHDWTKILIMYCDGVEHLGYRQSPIAYKNTSLYFRGSRNTQEHFYYLDKNYDIYNKDIIVVTGASAGGIGAADWVQYVADNTKTAKVYGMPDSGIFLVNYYNPITKKQSARISSEVMLKILADMKEQDFPRPIRECEKDLGDIISCTDSTNFAKYIEVPLFYIQSTYDEYVLRYILDVGCVTNDNPPASIITCNQTARNLIEDYRSQMMKAVHLMKQNKSNLGIWGIACIQHVFEIYSSLTNPKFQIGGFKLYEAIDKFLKNPEHPPWLLDEGQWPVANEGCNGLSFKNLLQEQ